MNKRSRDSRPKNGEAGLVAYVQKFSLHDGPGIRTTVFMKGCPLQCEWCANPENIWMDPQIMLYEMKCIHCGKCTDACPTDAISAADGLKDIAWEKCNQCLQCVEVCPSGGIETIGKLLSCDDLMTEISSDLLFYESSGGGVTFSGGEPLVQWKFVREMLKRCKAANIHTCLDTTGHVPWKILEQTLPYVDLVLYDLKHLDDKAHKDKTGLGNRMILDNLAKTARSARVWLRIPVIPGFNDSSDHMEEVGQLAVALGVEKVSLLPYHCWGEGKYARVGMTYSMSGVLPPTKEDMDKYQGILKRSGAEVSIGK